MNELPALFANNRRWATGMESHQLSVLQYSIDVLNVEHVMVVGHYGLRHFAADGQRLRRGRDHRRAGREGARRFFDLSAPAASGSGNP